VVAVHAWGASHLSRPRSSSSEYSLGDPLLRFRATCYDSLASQFQPEDFFAGIATHSLLPTLLPTLPSSSNGSNVTKDYHCWHCPTLPRGIDDLDQLSKTKMACVGGVSR